MMLVVVDDFGSLMKSNVIFNIKVEELFKFLLSYTYNCIHVESFMLFYYLSMLGIHKRAHVRVGVHQVTNLKVPLG